MLAFIIKVTHGVPSSALGICKGRGTPAMFLGSHIRLAVHTPGMNKAWLIRLHTKWGESCPSHVEIYCKYPSIPGCRYKVFVDSCECGHKQT